MKIREEIKIFWEGPFKIDDIIDGNIDAKYDVKSNSQGLYQVYSSHPLYGNNVLVYIGRTKNKNGFQSRLKGRWVIENGSDTENVEIYLGTIFSDSKKIEDFDNLIDKSEILLINAMKPAYNSSNIQSAHKNFIEENFILHNEGNYKNLYPVLDSKYFWKAYQNFTIINELSSKCNNKKIDNKDEYYGFKLNEGTEKTDKFTLWLCVDYEIWNINKIPLVIEVESTDKQIINKLSYNKRLKKHEYQDKDMGEIYYFDITEKLSNLDIEQTNDVCDEVLEYINQLLLL